MRNCAKLATTTFQPFFTLSPQQHKLKNIKSTNNTFNKKKSYMNVTSYPHSEVVKSDFEIYKLGEDEGHFLYNDEKIQFVTKNGIKHFVAVDERKLNYHKNVNYASADDTFIFIIGIFMSVMPFFKLENGHISNGSSIKQKSVLNKNSVHVNSKYDPFYVFMQSIKEGKNKKAAIESNKVVNVVKQNSTIEHKKEELKLVKVQKSEPALKNESHIAIKNGHSKTTENKIDNNIKNHNSNKNGQKAILNNKSKEEEEQQQPNLKSLYDSMVYAIQHGYKREEYRKISSKNKKQQLLEAPKLKNQLNGEKKVLNGNIENGHNQIGKNVINTERKAEEEKQKEYEKFVEQKAMIIKEIKQNIEARSPDKKMSDAGHIKLNKKIKDIDLDIMDLIVDLALLSTQVMNVNKSKLKPYLKENKSQSNNNQSDSYLYI